MKHEVETGVFVLGSIGAVWCKGLNCCLCSMCPIPDVAKESKTIILVIIEASTLYIKRIVLGTPNREPQEYSRNIVECKDLGKNIPITFLLFSRGSLFGVPSKVPVIHVFHTSTVDGTILHGLTSTTVPYFLYSLGPRLYNMS